MATTEITMMTNNTTDFNSEGNSSYVAYENPWTPDVIQRVATLTIIMFMTLAGNTLIILVLTCSRYRKRCSSRVNIFIINLAIGDLAVCVVTMTSEMLFVVFGEWVLGAAACKLIVYGQIVTLACTTFILTAMSFDRYLAICKPLKFSHSGRRARKMLAVCWVLAFLFAIPQLFIFLQTDEGIHPDGRVKHSCRSVGYTAMWQRKLYFSFLTIYILIIPTILITYCYANVVRIVWRQGKDCTAADGGPSIRRAIGDKTAIPRAKVRTIKMTLCIIVSFVVCWSPYFIVTLIIIFSEGTVHVPNALMSLVETLCLFNSAINPILYGFFNLRTVICEVLCASKVSTRRMGSFRSGYTTDVSIPDSNGLGKRWAGSRREKFEGLPLEVRLNGSLTTAAVRETQGVKSSVVSVPETPSPSVGSSDSECTLQRADSLTLHIRRLSTKKNRDERRRSITERIRSSFSNM